MPADDLQTRLNVAKLAALEAGRIQKRFLNTPLAIETKSSATDLVTEVDKRCDEAIRHIIRSFYPDDRLLTEETFAEGTPISLDNTWIVDPIDGTTNYAHGFPHFAVSIAYARHNQPQVGVIYEPSRDECFWAIAGQGAWLNDAAIATSATRELGQALLATGFPYDSQTHPRDNLGYFEAMMMRSHGVRRPGSAALDLAYVACGRLDGFWEFKLSPWDVAAGILLVREAGGLLSDVAGAALDGSRRRIDILAAGTKTLHEELIAVLAQVKTPAVSN